MNIPPELTGWIQEKLALPWSEIIEPRTVTREWCLRTGGRVMRAGLTASIAPAESLSVVFPTDSAAATYVGAVRNGMFSVLMGRDIAPILKCSLTFENFVIDELESNCVAFYRVSRQVTERLLGLVPGYRHNIAS